MQTLKTLWADWKSIEYNSQSQACKQNRNCEANSVIYTKYKGSSKAKIKEKYELQLGNTLIASRLPKVTVIKMVGYWYY